MNRVIRKIAGDRSAVVSYFGGSSWEFRGIVIKIGVLGGATTVTASIGTLVTLLVTS